MKHSIQFRVLSMLLAAALVFGMMPVNAFAADDETVATEATGTTEAAAVADATESSTEAAAEDVTEEVTTEATTEVTTEVTTEATTEVTTEATTEAATEESTEATEETVAQEELEVGYALFAAAADYDTAVSNEYFNVLSANTYNLAPGAIEKEIILNNDAGTDRKVAHVFEVDTTVETLQVMPGYYGIDKLNPDNLAGDSAIWQAKELTKTVAYYEDTLGYNVVGAMNTALAYDSNAPYGYMVWNGVVLGTPEVHKGAQTYLAIYKDGTCQLRSMSTPLDGNEWTAISANFGWLVKDGALTSTSVERTSSDASRSMIGIKADGTLVFCQVDGRNAPVSTGLSNYEMGEMMLALGCVNAVNCDGGGSSTFVSKREGTTENVMRSVPSDGSERPTINSVILVSTAGATGIFDHATLNAAYDYVAPGASVEISTAGVDTNGYPMDVPADITWQLDDDSFGTVANGVFTAGTEEGIVVVQMVYNGNVVGEKLLNIVHPDTFHFAEESTVIPYGKSAALDIVATYGADNWDVCVDGQYTLTLSDAAAATIEGAVLTAPTDESIAGVDVTITYKYDATLTDVITVAYGKGSEILFDFEDGDTADWMGFVDAKQWSIDNGVKNSLVGSDPLAGQFNEQISSDTFLASKANGGQVKHGQYSLAWSLDNTDAGFAGWSYNVLFYTGESTVLRDVANGKNATKLGMWLYIPEGATGLAFQSQLYVKNADGSMSCKQAHFTFTTASGAVKNLNSCTEADIPESRWVYASIDLTGYDYIALPDPYDESNSRSPSIVRTYVKPTEPAVHTFYIDDITLDYSSAVEDRVLPTISNVCYATADTAVTLEEGAVISGNTVSFSAKVADNAGLNASTGKILVDGISVGAAVSGSTLACGDVTLTSGVHTVTYQIEDKLGNLAKVTRTFTVAGDSVITLTGHNDSGAPAEYDSVYYADLVAADIAAIDSITATIKLQTANTWEPQGISVAEGFEASYSLNKVEGLLTVTVKRVGACSLTGEQTLISIPIRVWSWNGVNNVTGQAIAPATQFATGYCPIVTISCEVTYGSVTFVEGVNAGYLGAFGGTHKHVTNLNDNVNPWHYHDAQLTTLEQAATCTAAGYTGRTYCETCKSVISWGTTVPATGHTHQVQGDQLVCACGDIITGNGLVTANGKIYCLIADKLVTGWQAIGDGWCYAAVSTKEVQTGKFSVSGLTYTADETGIVVKGAWVTDANGTKYSYGPAFYTRSWHEIDGVTYYFGTDSYIYTGIQYIPVNRNNMKEGIIWYEFAEDGAYIGKVNGFVTYNDLKYYVVDGEFTYGGLMLIDGDYYYARTSGEIVCGKKYYISKTNGLLPAADYSFDVDGKMIAPPTTEEPEETEPTETTNPSETTKPTETEPSEPEVTVKNGVCADENGKLWYYVDGVKTYGGLMLIDGDYYYARTSGEIVVNRTYWTTKTNGLLPAADYTFGTDGKMVNAPTTEEPEETTTPTTEPEETTAPTTETTEPDPSEPEVVVKNGICADENGKLWYYVNDVKTYGGLMLIDGDYYYARTSGEIVCGRKYYTTKTNGLLPINDYTFGADGKMVNPPVTEKPEETTTPTTETTKPEETKPTTPSEPEKKNGICADENGKLWYYVNDVKTYGGLMLIDGDYYYARTSGEIVVGRKYFTTKTNGLLPANDYTFGADGKMIQ